MNIEGLSASEIGRRHAPDHIKDRAGWGRKWVKRELAAGTVLKMPDGTFKHMANNLVMSDRIVEIENNVAYEDDLPDMTQSEASHFAFYMKGGDMEAKPRPVPAYAHTYKAPHALRGTPPRLRNPNRRRKKLVCNR